MRALLDEHRSVIAACVGALPVGIAVVVSPDGAFTVGLTDARSGTPEEECVRDALNTARLEQAPTSAERIVHVLR